MDGGIWHYESTIISEGVYSSLFFAEKPSAEQLATEAGIEHKLAERLLVEEYVEDAHLDHSLSEITLIMSLEEV